MSAEEIDLHAQYERVTKPVPTVIVQLVEGKFVVTTGPRPIPREEYIYDWDTTWNEPGTEVIAVDQTIQFQKTVGNQPVMVQRVLEENPAGLGVWIDEVLHGKDPR